MNNTDKKLVEKLCSKLFLEHAYFLSVLAIHLKIEVISSKGFTAAATLGGRILLGKEFLATLSTEEQIGLLAHELYHIAFMHPQYMKEHPAKDVNKCNQAMDYEINLLIEQDGLKLPPGGLIDFKYEELTHQQIYDLLPDNGGKSQNSLSLDVDPNKGKDDSSSGGNGSSKEEVKGTAKKSKGKEEPLSDMEVAELVQQAVMQAELSDAGSTPGNIQRGIARLLQPKMDWAELLKDYIVTEFGKSDWSWKRPNRRYIHSGMYLPSQNNTEDVVGKIAVCIDVSGSISQELLDKFMAEVAGIVSDVRPSSTVVKLFDTCTTLTKVFEKNEPITPIKLVGGGGTHIHKTLKELKKIDDILCTVILTDMYIMNLDNIPKLSSAVLWCRYNNTDTTPPYGEVIDLEI